jgi:hypothetical protein
MSGNENGGGLDSMTKKAMCHAICLGYVLFNITLVWNVLDVT